MNTFSLEFARSRAASHPSLAYIVNQALDCRAKLLNRISNDLGMRILNFQAFTRGKWTWHGGEKKSVLDYAQADVRWACG